MKPLKNPKLLLAVFLLAMIATPLIPHINASTLTITISTDEPYYLISESITIYGNLTYNGSPVQDWPVALEVQDPNNTPVVTRTLQTDTNGAYNLTFKLPAKAKLGTYTAYASSSYKGETASNNTTFEFTALVQNINTRLGYMAIQAAIDAPETLNGHTILVKSGVYHEHVTISKSLVLVGENKDSTIIDGDGTGIVVRITADNTVISGFTIQNSGAWPNSGINLYHTQNSSVYWSNMLHNYYGIRLEYSFKCSIFDNNISDNVEAGIRIDSSDNNTISHNTIAHNDFGISQWPSLNNVVEGNIIKNNTKDGIWLGGSGNIITRNAVIKNTRGMNIHGDHNTIYRNNVSNNTDIAILLPAACNNTISDNNIERNQWGILLGQWEGVNSTYNTITGNNIANNNFAGIGMDHAFNNRIYHNNIINNARQAWISNSSDNVWDNGYPSGGNYWSDYSGVDLCSGPHQNLTGSDGIGDTQYVIDSSNTDRYPLMKPYPWGPRDVGITGFAISKTVAGQGYNLTISTMMFNYGNSTENFNLTVYANATIIYETTVNLTSRNSTTITLAWNTTSLTKGYYTIWVYAEPVPGETDTTDNTFVYGLITVTIPGDVDGDFDVDIYDVVKITSIYGSTRSDPEFNPNSDLDDDGEITIYDVVRCTSHYGDVDP